MVNRSFCWALASIAAIGPIAVRALEREPVNSAFVAQLIQQMDDDNYFLREKALEKLKDLGMPALPALGEALIAGSPEVAWRASVAVETIAISGDEQQMQHVAELLKQLSARKPHLATLASELAVRQQWARHETAVSQLQSLGAHLAGGDGESLVDIGAFAPGIVEIEEEMVEVEEVAEVEEGKGIFGALRAIARALLPGIEPVDPEAPPLPLELEAAEAAADEPPKSDEDVEFLRRAPVRGEDVEIVEAEEPAVMEAEELIAFDMFGGEIDGEDYAEGGISHIALDKAWRGGDSGLAHLKDIKGLASLDVQDAALTDAGLKYFESIAGLQQLTLRGSKFTVQGLRRFREVKPDVRIWAFGPVMMGVGADMGSTPLVLNHVYPRSGAQDAGLASGDIVRRIDGVEIRDFTDLMLSVYQRKVGDKLKVEFEREGKLRTADVALKSRQAVERGVDVEIPETR